MISQWVAAINAKLVSIGAWCQTIQIGDEYAEEIGDAPRITLVQLAETYAPPSGPGGNPRPLWDRYVACEVIVWGLTLSDTEGLIDQFIIALHRATKDTSTSAHARGGTYRMGKGRWDRTTNLDKRGFQYRLGVELVIPVLDRDWSTTPAEAPADSTYTGDQILTYPLAPDGTNVVANVARGDDEASDDPTDEVETSGLQVPTLATIQPISSEAVGGDPIVLTGTWLEGATVTVGGTSAAVTSSAYGTLTFTMPAVALGAHAVIATTAAGASNALTITAT